jgi:hypothetical protein
VVKKSGQLMDLVGIMTANTVEGLLLGYGTLLDIAPIPPSAMDKLAANRWGWWPSDVACPCVGIIRQP